MLIVVNGMYLQYPLAGIAKYIIWGCHAFSKKAKILIVSNRIIDKSIKNEIGYDNVEYIEKKFPVINSTLLWFFFIFPYVVNKINPDILWSPAVWKPPFIKKKIKKLVTVHDFVSTEFKKTMKFGNRIISSIIESHSIKKADYIWTVSEYTKKKLIHYYPKRKCEKIFVGNAPSDFWCKKEYSEDEINVYFNKFNLKGNFLLFVGSLEPRKNLAFLLTVFKEYSKKHDVMLVIVGATGWGNTGINEIVNARDYPFDKLIFMPFISEEELKFLYNKASCYISTSLNEGFGMPQAEAMKCGCPVVTSHNSAMIEIVYGAGITVDSWNVNEWCSAIEDACINSKTIVDRQSRKINNYNWQSITTGFFDYIGE